MKVKVILFIAFLIGTIGYTQASDIVKTERIQKVIVFRNGAQIESKVSQTTEKGEHLFIIDELPNSLDEQTVQVSGEGDFTILSVESKTGDLDVKRKSKNYKSLLDSIEYYLNLIDMDNIKKYAVDQEENLLITNKNISSKQSAQVVDIEDLADLYRRRLPELKKESYRLQKQITENSQKLQALRTQLEERQSGKNNKQVWVRVSLSQAQNVRLNLKYLVQDASWNPMYDVRCEDIGEGLEFILKANVQQSTGVNWDNVELSLSTGNPMSFSNKPVLNEWRLAIVDYLPTRNINNLSSTTAGVYQTEEGAALNVKGSRSEANDYYVDGVKVRAAKFVAANQTEQANNVQYNITKSFSIPSDGDVKTIEIQRNEIKASYRYVSIPKLDNKAYLLASVNDWDKILILAGEANIFLKGAYVTKTYLDPMSINDSLEISLGNDEGIKVERKMVKEMTSKKTMGSTKRLMQGYEITVRNSKSKAINIEIEDQVPLSVDKDIEVKHTAINANHNVETGKLLWRYTIAPSETKTMAFQLEVKYPKNKVLQGW